MTGGDCARRHLGVAQPPARELLCLGATSSLRVLDRRCGVVERLPELAHEALEQRVHARPVGLVKRGPPRLPAFDQRATEQNLYELEVKRSLALERGELLEEVEFSVEDVSLGGVGSDVGRERVAQLLG